MQGTQHAHWRREEQPSHARLCSRLDSRQQGRPSSPVQAHTADAAVGADTLHPANRRARLPLDTYLVCSIRPQVSDY